MLAYGVKETTTTTGTGTLTLSGVTNFPRFSNAFAVGDLVYYSICTNDSPPAPMEWGMGTIGASNTLARTKVFGTFSSGTYNTTSPTALSLAAGTYNVFNSQVVGGCPVNPPGYDTTNSSLGAHVPAPWYVTASAAALATTADRLYLPPFMMDSPRPLVAVKMRVSTLAAGNCRMGIYRCTSSGTPGALMATSGDISTGAGGVITWTLSTSLIFAPAWYFFGFATKGITPSVNVSNPSSVFMSANTPVGVDSTAVQPITYKYVALTGGWTDLPDPPSSTQTAVATMPPAFSFVMG